MSGMEHLASGAERLLGTFQGVLALHEPAAGAEEIRAALDELRAIANVPGFLDQTVGAILPGRPRDYRAFWDLAREAAGLFRTGYLPPGDRERLWREYSDLCARVKELGRVERAERAATSSANANRVRSLLQEAHLWAGGASSGNDFAEARAWLGKAMEILKAGPFLHRDRQDCFTAWREVAAELDSCREGVRRENFDALTGRLRDAFREVSSGNTFEATGMLRGLKEEIWRAEVSREQRALLRQELRDLWGVLIRRIEARKAERARREEERERRQAIWRDRQSRRLDDLAVWREENDRRIATLEAEAEDLEEKIANAWNDNWAERTRGWAETKYAKIRDLEARNEELERQMAEIRSLSK